MINLARKRWSVICLQFQLGLPGVKDGSKTKGGLGGRVGKKLGGFASFEPSQRVGHPIFEPMEEWVMIVLDLA